MIPQLQKEISKQSKLVVNFVFLKTRFHTESLQCSVDIGQVYCMFLIGCTLLLTGHFVILAHYKCPFIIIIIFFY